MAREWSVLAGAGLGVGLVYMFDPAAGRGRRRRIARRATSVARESTAVADRAARRIGGGVKGAAAAVGRPFRHGRPFGLPGELPDEQPSESRPPEASPLVDERWPASRRCLASSVGSALVAWGIRRGDAVGVVLGCAGAALVARSAANRSLIEAARIRKGPKLVGVRKTVTIQAPVETVYGLWTRYETFPRFMSTLKEVVDLGQGRSRWTVTGPAGVPVSWDAEVTRLVENEALEWTSLPGSAVPNEGAIQFESTPEGGTRVDIHLRYHPPAGALGQLAARLFGADARSQMEEDLRELKASLENGGAVSRDQAAVVSPPSNVNTSPVT
jgi:uncharacterized membrane protein